LAPDLADALAGVGTPDRPATREQLAVARQAAHARPNTTRIMES
jgi:hypothetical protein